MTANRKQPIRKRRIPPQELEARAGLIPASDHTADERRARMDGIIHVVKTYASLCSHRPGNFDRLAITELLVDLRHYCDLKGLALDELDEAASVRYLEEADGQWGSGD